MFLSKVAQKLKSSAQKRPLLFNSMIYGSFYIGAEFAQQTYSKIFKVIILFPTIEVYDCHDQNFFAEKLETLLEISRNQSKSYCTPFSYCYAYIFFCDQIE